MTNNDKLELARLLYTSNALPENETSIGNTVMVAFSFEGRVRGMSTRWDQLQGQLHFQKKQKKLCHSEQAPGLVVSAAMLGISAQYLTIPIGQ